MSSNRVAFIDILVKKKGRAGFTGKDRDYSVKTAEYR